MLGLGLVVAIIALLLVGTFKGRTSYMATTKTMDSKLLELQDAYELKHAIAALSASNKPPDQGDRESEENRIDSGNRKNELLAKVASAKAALATYESQLRDTVERHRDPDDGYVP